jgi:hypothetical protein
MDEVKQVSEFKKMSPFDIIKILDMYSFLPNVISDLGDYYQ